MSRFLFRKRDYRDGFCIGGGGGGLAAFLQQSKNSKGIMNTPDVYCATYFLSFSVMCIF